MRLVLASVCTGLTVGLAFLACGDGSGSSSGATSSNGGAGLDNGGLLGGGDTGGNGLGSGDASGGGSGGAADCNPKVRGVLRDFRPNSLAHNVPPGVTKGTNPDFQNLKFDEPDPGTKPDRGIVQATLGSDRKPVYAHDDNGTLTTHGPGPFAEWFHDTPEKNKSVIYELPLFKDESSGRLVFDSADLKFGGNGVGFFPLDGFPNDQTFPKDGVGSDNKPHKFSFTFEIHMQFKYNGGETFRFTGDDDVWVFVNNKLTVIDLGGIHGPGAQDGGEGTIDFDKEATSLGIEKGKEYSFDVFQAERHTTGSNFRLETSLGFTNCNDIILR